MRCRYSRPMRAASIIVLFFFMWSFGGLRDIAYAAKTATVDKPQTSAKPQSHEKQPAAALEDSLGKITDLVNKMVNDKTNRVVRKNELKDINKDITVQDKKLRNQFAITEKKLKNAGLSEEILKRHYSFVAEYEENFAELEGLLTAIDLAKAGDEENQAIELANQFLQRVRPRNKHQALVPSNLPHKSAGPTNKKPRLKKEDFGNIQRAQLISPAEGYGRLYPGRSLENDGYHPVATNNIDPILVAANGPLTNLLDTLPVAYNAYPINDGVSIAGLEDISTLLIAQSSDLPLPGDLGETIEVQLTEAISAKAAELGHDPIEIYNWVRNNIEFVPTYGSIQGADYCLQTEQCNAYDTSSLLVAMLRASNIPARYAEGTVEIEIDKFMNWVGDFTDATAAMTFARSGGIPLTGIVEGGKFARVQMEHIWVEAWVDYFPSRGSKHKNGQGDTWIALDGSYKQHSYSDGMNIASVVPFDAESFVDQLTASAVIDEMNGYVTGVDSLLIQQATTDYTSQVEGYINQNYPDATVGDVLGTKDITEENFSYLLGTLPYRQLVTGTKKSGLDDTIRHQWDVSINGVAPISYSASLPELAGKKITLSYSPATQADEDIIASYLPGPHPDGTPIDPSELPSSLPAYLINLKPELRINGQVVAAGGAVQMGTTEDWSMKIASAGQPIRLITNTIEAGDYVGVGLDLGRISQKQLEGIKAKLGNTKAKLEAEDFAGLTKDDLLGDLLTTTAISYYAEYDALDYMAARTMKVNNIRLPSETHFYNDLQIATSFFGMPVSASPGGLVMDVDANTVVAVARDGSSETRLQFMRTSGLNSSALEHAVPEQLFSTPDNPAEGVSAVKALQIANDQDIPIFTIDSSNLNLILPQLQLDADVITDITSAVNSGKEVTVSQSNITFHDWTGCGYIVFDPVTGEGAYLITGGLSGAIITALALFLAAFFIIAVIGGLLTGVLGPILATVILAILPLFLIFLYWLSFQAKPKTKACIGTVAFVGLIAIFASGMASGVAKTVVGVVRSYIGGAHISMACLDMFDLQ